MKNFKLENINLEKDKPQIMEWDKEFGGKPEYESIEHYVLEDDLMFNLGKVIEINYERFPIGEDEKKLMLVAKTEQQEILGFIILNLFDLQSKSPQMFLQYIVVNPKYQHKGYGKQMLEELIIDPKKYTKVEPKETFSYIDKTNYSSISMFLRLGYTLESVGVNNDNSTCFFKAKANMKDLQQIIEKKSFS